MAEIMIQDIDSNTLHKLEALAKQHGRSLQAEIKHILESVAQAQLSLSPTPIDRLKRLKQTIVSLQNLSIREMIEERRRF